MRKALGALVALAVALLLLASLFLYQRHRERTDAAPRLAFETASAASVLRLHVEYRDDSVTLQRVNGNWVTAVDRFPADTARMRRVLGNLLGMQTRELVSQTAESDARLAEFGLNAEVARRVVWTLSDGRTIRVLLGKTSGIDYGSSFWKPAEGSAVYRTPGTFVFEISARSQDWKDTSLFTPVPVTDIRSLRVEWASGNSSPLVYRIDRIEHSKNGEQDEYVLREPLVAPAKAKVAAALFRHANQFKVDAFVPGVDSQKINSALDHPAMRVQMLLRDGSVRTITAGAFVDDLYRYVRHPTHPDPVRVFIWRINDFKKTAEELVERE